MQLRYAAQSKRCVARMRMPFKKAMDGNAEPNRGTDMSNYECYYEDQRVSGWVPRTDDALKSFLFLHPYKDAETLMRDLGDGCVVEHSGIRYRKVLK